MLVNYGADQRDQASVERVWNSRQYTQRTVYKEEIVGTTTLCCGHEQLSKDYKAFKGIAVVYLFQVYDSTGRVFSGFVVPAYVFSQTD